MSGQSQGSQTQLCMDASAIDVNSEPYNFLTFQGGASYGLIDDGAQSIRGTRSHPEERVGLGLIDVRFQITMNPTAAELDNLFPRILGAAESTDTFALAETLPSFNVALDRVAKVHTYSTCYVDKATFSGSKGDDVKLTLDIIGTSESEGAAGSFPSLDFSTGCPYQFNEGVLTLAGTTHLYNQFVLVIDNHLEREFNNSTTATDIIPADRTVALSVSTPYTSTEAGLYTTPGPGGPSRAGLSSGSTNTLVFTDGGISTTFTFGNLKALPLRSPNVNGKRAIRLGLQYKAYLDSNGNELVVTHDPVA